MEPNDPQLHDLLKEWKAPEASPGLEKRVLARRGAGWRFLLSGTLSVPVPVACAAAIFMLLTGWWLARQTEPAAPCVTAIARICNTFDVCKT
jgi:hypothetical protein